MNAVEYMDKLWDIFTNDEELVDLLAIDPTDEAAYVEKFREQDQAVTEFEAADLSFIAYYFADAQKTRNDFMNIGFLYIDIYSDSRANSTAIRSRIVQLMHEHFDERIRAEGQRTSGVKNVYKYRLEFTPLIFT